MKTITKYPKHQAVEARVATMDDRQIMAEHGAILLGKSHKGLYEQLLITQQYDRIRFRRRFQLREVIQEINQKLQLNGSSQIVAAAKLNQG